ncbi:MAG: ABC-2 family transporter protein [Myxococcota bacterium]|nr:ABC-2 family transporter protein [Myxococcota bacterium]
MSVGPTARASLGLGLQLAMAWRLDVLTRLLSGGVVLLLTGALWTAVTDGRPQVAGRPAAELVSYAVIAWVVGRIVATPIDHELGERTRTGAVVHDLLRPGSIVLHFWARDAGRALVVLLSTALPLGIVGMLLFEVDLPATPGPWIAAAGSLMLGHAVAVGLALFVGALSLRAGRADGLVHAKGLMVVLLSGSLVPLDVYPDAITRVARALPFAAMADAPADLLVRGVGIDAAFPVLGRQAAWAMVLFSTASVALRFARRAPSLRGG